MRLRSAACRDLNRVLKAVSGAPFKRLYTKCELCRLLFTGKYLAEPLGMFRRLSNGLAVGYLRLTDTGFHLKVLQHTGCKNIQVQLTHTGDDELSRFRILAAYKSRIFP